jgi:hypothetical protein
VRKLLVAVLVTAILAAWSVSTVVAAPGDLSPSRAFSDIAGHPAEEALTILGALGVFTGGFGLGGPVEPDGAISRAQYCKVVIIGTGREALAVSREHSRPSFKDSGLIPSWAWGFVNAAVGQGIINGYPDKTFRPDDPVTYGEAVAMLVRSIPGHDGRVPKTAWPTSYTSYGAAKGFTGGVSTSVPNAPCTRGDMARMLVATMQVDPLDGSGLPDIDGAILEDHQRWWTGTLTGRTGGEISLGDQAGPIVLGDPVYMLNASSYDVCRGGEVLCVADAARRVVVISRRSGGATAGYFRQLGADATGPYLEVKEGDKRFYYTGSVRVVLNKDGVTPNTQASLREGDYLEVTLNASGLVTAVKATRYDVICARSGAGPDYAYAPHPEDYVASFSPSSSGQPARLVLPVISPFHYFRPGSGWLMTASAGFEIGAQAEVYVNSLRRTRDELAEKDVVKMATFGAKGYTDQNSIVYVRATRSVVEGTVVSNGSKTDAEGVHYYTRLKTGDVESDHERHDDYLSSPPGIGTRQRYGADGNAALLCSIPYPDEFPVVFVNQAGTTTDGTTTRYHITCDVRGTTLTYECSADRSSWVQSFRRLTIEGSTRRVIAGTLLTPEGSYTVMAHTSTTVTLQIDSVTRFGPNPVVYRKSNDTYTYIGCEGLTDGWTVSAFIMPDGSIGCVVYMT